MIRCLYCNSFSKSNFSLLTFSLLTQPVLWTLSHACSLLTIYLTLHVSNLYFTVCAQDTLRLQVMRHISQLELESIAAKLPQLQELGISADYDEDASVLDFTSCVFVNLTQLSLEGVGDFLSPACVSGIG